MNWIGIQDYQNVYEMYKERKYMEKLIAYYSLPQFMFRLEYLLYNALDLLRR